MHSEGLNALLVAAPLLVVLVAWGLRVDERLFSSDTRRKSAERRGRFAVVVEDGEVLLTDPDGRTIPARRN